MNVFTFTGRLTKDAEFRSTPTGLSILQFSVANNTGFGDRQKTNFVNCSLFGKRAEGNLKNYLTKGKEVAVSGELNLNTFKKRDGSEGAALECKVSSVDLVGGLSSSSAPATDGGNKATADSGWSQARNSEVDDIPF